MPEHEHPPDGVAEYVLGQLDPGEREAFEARLAASPELRAAVQEVEAACEALALSAPQLRPNPAVWNRIQEKTGSLRKEESIRVGFLNWAGWLRIAWRGRWAVAALLALGWWAHVWFSQVDPRSESTGEELEMAASNGDGPSTRQNAPGPIASRTDAGRRGNGVASNPTEDGASAPNQRREQDASRLRAWVQQLAGEVADLNRTLEQHLALPEGAGRFEVFRLAGTNVQSGFPREALEGKPFASQQHLLEQWLASALVHQLSALRNPQANPESPDPDNDGPHLPDASLPSGTVSNLLASVADNSDTAFQVVDLSSDTRTDSAALSDTASRPPPTNTVALLTGDTAGLGFYSADTGRGSIALVFAQPVPQNQTLQFWALDDSTGATISLGTTTASGVSLFVRFEMNPATVVNPGFMVTFEPSGGSTSPTGPIIVRPPPASGPPPQSP